MNATLVSEGRGNVLAAVACLMGLLSQDLTGSEGKAARPYFPLLRRATVTRLRTG